VDLNLWPTVHIAVIRMSGWHGRRSINPYSNAKTANCSHSTPGCEQLINVQHSAAWQMVLKCAVSLVRKHIVERHSMRHVASRSLLQCYRDDPLPTRVVWCCLRPRVSLCHPTSYSNSRAMPPLSSVFTINSLSVCTHRSYPPSLAAALPSSWLTCLWLYQCGSLRRRSPMCHPVTASNIWYMISKCLVWISSHQFFQIFSTINHLHFTLLFVFTSTRFSVIF